MKGIQKLTLSNEALVEAVQEYLNRRSLEAVSVSSVEAPNTSKYGSDAVAVEVTFESREKPDRIPDSA